MDVSFREVFRTTDPVSVQMAAGLLRDAGLDARIRGTMSGASIGVGEQILEKRIEVPAAQEARARAVIERYLLEAEADEDADADDGSDELDDDTDDAVDEDDPDELDADDAPGMSGRMRSPVVRWGVALVILGPVVVGIALALAAMVRDATH